MDDDKNPDQPSIAKDEPLQRMPADPPETYVTPEGAPTTLQSAPLSSAPTPAPKPKSKSTPKWVVYGVTVLLILGLGAAVALFYAEAQKARNDLKASEQTVTNLRTELAKANSSDDKDDTTTEPKLTIDDQIKLAASNYLCSTVDFSCNKSVSTVTQKQAPAAGKPGFALVTVTGTMSTKLYLKSVSTGDEWIVVFEGQNVPSAEVTKKFSIPADFTGANAAQ